MPQLSMQDFLYIEMRQALTSLTTFLNLSNKQDLPTAAGERSSFGRYKDTEPIIIRPILKGVLEH